MYVVELYLPSLTISKIGFMKSLLTDYDEILINGNKVRVIKVTEL
jgi:hypothetical protein